MTLYFGHGTWNFVAQQSQIEHGNRTDVLSAPVFIWDDWKNSLNDNGFIIFGHIHGRNTFGKKIFYPGSFTRWNFGERSEKGFAYFELEQNEEQNVINYSVEYKNNTEAPKYEVFQIQDIVEKPEKKTVDELKKGIDEKLKKYDNIRVDLFGLSDDKVKILKEHYSSNMNIKFEIRKKTQTTKLNEESEVDDAFEKYHYITKRQLPLPETIQRFCKEEMNISLDLEEIKTILKENNEE